MYRFIQKALDWGVKIASLAVTGPATWVVATELFADIESPILLFAMRFAAVFLVEGVLLSNWLLLEFDKSATPEIKVRYGVTALTMYVALLVIGWRHEGPTGIVFRVALLAALIGSGWDTYVYTWQRMTASVDRSPENSGSVKRHARNLAIKEWKMRREAEHKVTTALINADETGQLHGAGLYKQRLIAGNDVQHEEAWLEISEKSERLEAQANGKKKRPPQLASLAMGDRGLRTSSSILGNKAKSLPLTQAILAAIDDDPGYSVSTLSVKLGVPADVVSSEIEGLMAVGRLSWDGQKYVVEDNGRHGGNGKPSKLRSRG